MTIGQLARQAGINPRTLRYYERIGLLVPSSRTEAGYRVYTQQDADRLVFIRRAQRLGLSLAEIAEIIAVREGGVPPCQHVRALAEAKITEIDARMMELGALREELTRLMERASEVEPACTDAPSVCLAFDSIITS